MSFNRSVKRKEIKNIKKKISKDAKKISDKEIHLNPMDLYNKPRSPGDLDLVALIRDHIYSLDKDSKHGLAFFNNADIQLVKNKNQVVQRFIINRVLINKLLVYKSLRQEVVINDVLPYIANDGYLEDWVTLLKEIVLPFFIKNDVFIETMNI